MNYESNKVKNNTLSEPCPYQSGVYVLSCIPLFGLLMSILTFIIVDLILGKKIFGNATSMIPFRTTIERVEKESYPNCNGKKVEVLPDNVLSRFCELCQVHKILVEFQDISDKELHMINMHVEQNFVDSVITNEDLYTLSSLCNLVLDFEISSSPGFDKISTRIMCPYSFEGGHLSEKLLKLHLVHFHHDVLVNKIQALVDIHENRGLKRT